VIGEGICEVSDEKMQSLSKVLDEVEEKDFVNYRLMQADDAAQFLPVLPFDTDKQSVHNVISSNTLAAFLNN
jgi:mannitol/fructose-specific phosphotransferase system IIA component